MIKYYPECWRMGRLRVPQAGDVGITATEPFTLGPPKKKAFGRAAAKAAGTGAGRGVQPCVVDPDVAMPQGPRIRS